MTSPLFIRLVLAIGSALVLGLVVFSHLSGRTARMVARLLKTYGPESAVACAARRFMGYERGVVVGWTAALVTASGALSAALLGWPGWLYWICLGGLGAAALATIGLHVLHTVEFKRLEALVGKGNLDGSVDREAR